MCLAQPTLPTNSLGPIFLPAKDECHGKVIKLSGRQGTLSTLYTRTGTTQTKMYIGTCIEPGCMKKFFPFYEENDVDDIKVRKFYKPVKYFACTSKSIFETKYLLEVTGLANLCSSEFRNICEIYNENNDQPEFGNLNYQVLEDAYLCFHIAMKIPMCPLVVNRMKANNKLDVEHLCSQAFPIMRKVMSDNFLKHECTSDIGCALKLAIIDGNEKNKRKLCSAPKTHIADNLGKPNFYKLCTGNPLLGKKSKFCESHYNNENKDDCQIGDAPAQQDLRPVTRQYAKVLMENNLLKAPESDNDGIGCRKAESIKKFYETTAGIISIIRPCGIRLGTYECYTKESLSQLLLCLIDKFGSEPDPTELKVIVADVACGLCPFVMDRKHTNEAFHNFSKLTFVLDTFHGDKVSHPKRKNLRKFFSM